MDPEVVGSCIPGVKSFSTVEPGTYAFEVGFRVGIVSGAYEGTLEIHDIDAPNSYRMVVQSAGGGVTILSFDGDVHVTGILARVGQRMMSNVAKQQIDRLFRCLSAKADRG